MYTSYVTYHLEAFYDAMIIIFFVAHHVHKLKLNGKKHNEQLTYVFLVLKNKIKIIMLLWLTNRKKNV